MRLFAATLAATVVACMSATGGSAATAPTRSLYAVGYTSRAALVAAVTSRAEVVRSVPAIRVAEIRTASVGLVQTLQATPGIRFIQRVVSRKPTAEPALVTSPVLGAPYEWQYAAVHEDLVPQSVLRAAASVTIAVIDTGADLTAPDLAANPAPSRTHAGFQSSPNRGRRLFRFAACSTNRW